MLIEEIETKFKPITLRLTIQTQEELDQLYFISNHSAIVDTCTDLALGELEAILTDIDTGIGRDFELYAGRFEKWFSAK